MKKIIIFLVPILLFSLISCGGKKFSSKKDDKPIIAASKIDTEGALLGNMIVQILESNGYNVSNQTEFGTTALIRKAIIAGEIDIYPEYTGNGKYLFPGSFVKEYHDFEKGYKLSKSLDYQINRIIWLQPAPANNTWAIAIRKDLSEKNNLKTLEDFAKYINNGGKVKIACSDEFVNRPDSLPAFEKAYGFKLKKNQLLILSGGNTANTEKAAAEQTSGVNAAMAYGTDGQLSALNLVILEDNKNVQPIYAPTPIIRKRVLDKYPEIEELLKDTFKSLDLVTLQKLNSQIAVEGKNAKDVAIKYLKDNNFIK